MKIDIIDLDLESIVDALRELYTENNLSIDKALAIVKAHYPNTSISRSTIAKVFRKDGDKNFKWEATLKPIVTALLNSPDIKSGAFDVYNSVLQLKRDTIKGIQDERDEEKRKYHERLEKETAKFQRSLDFLREQIALKDKRIDQLLKANDSLTETNNRLINQILDCPLKNKECKG